MSRLSLSNKKEVKKTTHPWCVVQWIKNRLQVDNLNLGFTLKREIYRDGASYIIPEWTIEGDMVVNGDFRSLNHDRVQEIIQTLRGISSIALIQDMENSLEWYTIPNSTNIECTVSGLRIYVRTQIRSSQKCFYCLGAYNSNKHAPIPVNR